MSEQALLPSAGRPRWRTSRFTPRHERIFFWIATSLISLMTAAWSISVIDVYSEKRSSRMRPDNDAVPVARAVSSAILDPRSSSTAFIGDAALKFLDPLRGESGKLKVAFRAPGGTLAAGAGEGTVARYEDEQGDEIVSNTLTTPEAPGIYKIAVEIDRAKRSLDDLNLVTLVPFGEKRGGKIGLYYLGTWPFEGGGNPRSRSYANPQGFIEVTTENRDTYVSEHFKLRDFLTKDQPNVWPKYLLIDPKMLDKLELVIGELQASGYRVEHVHVMSGFRTPRYNHGGGNTTGRANLSRHMYGDAADVYVDNDRDGQPDDLNRDGRTTVADAETFAAAADQVERKHPALVGGVGIYTACCGHGPFTHIDVRGFRARWRGTGNG